MAGNTTPPLVTELTLQDINKATLALSKQIQPAGSGPIVGTSTSLAQQNPTLAAGQIGYETDTKFFKIGDGTTTYNSLMYQLQRTLETVYTPLLTGFGTATAIDVYWSRNGNRIKGQGHFVSGIPSGALAGIGFPVVNGSQIVTDSALIAIGATFVVGVIALSIVGAGSYYCICGPGQAGVSVGIQSAGAAALTAVAGNAMGISAGNEVAFTFETVAKGWNV